MSRYREEVNYMLMSPNCATLVPGSPATANWSVKSQETRKANKANKANDLSSPIGIVEQLRSGEEISADHPYGWLRVFDSEELADLLEETQEALSQPDALDELDAVIYEWHESAIAIESPELAEAFLSNEFEEEVMLTKPAAKEAEDV